MIAKGIVIRWQESSEYIEIDPSAPTITPPESTLEIWKDNSTYKHNVDCKIKRGADGVTEIILYYDPGKNPHIKLEKNSFLAGKATIYIQPGCLTGKTMWESAHEDFENGPGEWKRIDAGLLKEKKRERISRIEREQAAFRNALLALKEPSQCAITGEKMKFALEAAHIIPSKSKGAEVIQNGILLRADIHRLYDAGIFIINPSGDIEIMSENISEYYRTTLENKKIDQKEVDRICDALKVAYANHMPRQA